MQKQTPAAMASSAISILLLVSFLTAVDGGGIGVNYGRSASNLPPPAAVAQFLARSTTFDRVRIFDADPAFVQAFANTDLAVDITVPDNLIANLTDLRFARRWVRANVAPHVDVVNVARILLGNEVVSSAHKPLVVALVPAMQNLHTALIAHSLQHRIKVAAPQSLAVLAASNPPSAGRFRDGAYGADVMRPLLSFLRATGAPFMVNAYPFFGCTIDTLGFALFRAGDGGGGVVDEETGGVYTNMLDAQIDAVHSAMRRLGFGDVEIVVAETGWPSAGEPGEVGVSVDNAREYNRNLVAHVAAGAGTPLMPNQTVEVYIFSLFNEELKPGPASEKNFGLFRKDMSPVYDIGVLKTEVIRGEESNTPVQALNPSPLASSSSSSSAAASRRWCVPKPNTEMLLLQENIEYVCGEGIDCEAVNPGGRCYFPDTVAAHAAFLMNEYYQAFGRNAFDCDFGQTGMITGIDPSYGSCKYSS